MCVCVCVYVCMSVRACVCVCTCVRVSLRCCMGAGRTCGVRAGAGRGHAAAPGFPPPAPPITSSRASPEHRPAPHRRAAATGGRAPLAPGGAAV